MSCLSRVRPVALTLCLLAALSLGGPRHAASDAAAIERGRYVAAAANCVSCHTRPGGEPFAGGLAIETPLGTIHSTNITPDTATGIGAWSAEDFRRALREGIAADGSHLFPAFPYTAYTRMSDADIADLFVFLRAQPAVTWEPPANGWPFAIRWPMAIWNWLYLEPGPRAPDPAQSAEWNRGRYLVEGPGHCGACHTPRNLLLAERTDLPLAGARVMGPVPGGAQRPWFAVDLRSTRQGLAAWRAEDLARYFAQGWSLRAAAAGPMTEVIGNSLRHLRAEDQRAMAVYLKTLQGEDAAPAPIAPAQVEAGRAIYERRCRKCHGSSGRGGLFIGPPLAGSAVAQAEDPASFLNLLLFGSIERADIAPPSWERMPALGKRLDDAEIAAVANYVRASWGNRAAELSREDVQRQR